VALPDTDLHQPAPTGSAEGARVEDMSTGTEIETNVDGETDSEIDSETDPATSAETTTDTATGASTGAARSATEPAPRQRRFLQNVKEPRRLAIFGVYLAALLGWLLFYGLPTDYLLATVWIWAGTIAWRYDRPVGEHFGFARDWLPIIGLLVVYDVSRGHADNGRSPHVMAMIDADKFMFGWLTDGKIPTVWLQDHLYHPGRVPWWEVISSFTYFSHFVVALIVAATLWVRHRPTWAAFMRRWFGLTALGLATYFLYPAAPPWWAADEGYLSWVDRISSRGFTAVGMESADKLITYGQSLSNPVAAMPSLHSGFAALVVGFFLFRVRARWRPLLLMYPLAMTFALVYAGEHYVIDVLVGWVYVVVTLVGVSAAERWWSRVYGGRASAGDTAPVSPAVGSPAQKADAGV
jgi:hypothetical protein